MAGGACVCVRVRLSPTTFQHTYFFQKLLFNTTSKCYEEGVHSGVHTQQVLYYYIQLLVIGVLLMPLPLPLHQR